MKCMKKLANVRVLDICSHAEFLSCLSVMFRPTEIAERYGFNECHL